MSNGNAHDRTSVNLLLNIAEMADVRLDTIGPSTGRLEI